MGGEYNPTSHLADSVQKIRWRVCFEFVQVRC